MDKQLKDEIVKVVSQATAQAYEVYNEKYLTPDALCEQFQMITPSWIKEHGHKLPRAKFTTKGKDGREKSTRYGYPQHKIARMIAEGNIRI